MTFDEGQAIGRRQSILIVGEEWLGPAPEVVRLQLVDVMDLERLKRMLRGAVKAANWQEILETP